MHATFTHEDATHWRTTPVGAWCCTVHTNPPPLLLLSTPLLPTNQNYQHQKPHVIQLSMDLCSGNTCVMCLLCIIIGLATDTTQHQTNPPTASHKLAPTRQSHPMKLGHTHRVDFLQCLASLGHDWHCEDWGWHRISLECLGRLHIHLHQHKGLISGGTTSMTLERENFEWSQFNCLKRQKHGTGGDRSASYAAWMITARVSLYSLKQHNRP